jgi:hypothetical protein
MRNEFRKFDDLLDEKNPKKFTETFLRLQSVQLEHARSIKVSPYSPLSVDALVESRKKKLQTDLISFSNK